MLSVSTDTLAFAASAVPYGNRLASVARSGDDLQIAKERELQNWPRLSPDGRRLALQRVDPLGGNHDVWVDDLVRGTRLRVTIGPDNDLLPVWSPDGRQLAYLTDGLDARHLSIAAADGSGVVRILPCPRQYCEPTDWGSDGEWLLVNVHGGRGGDVWTVSTDSSKAAQPLLTGGFSQRDARFSPDGRWVAYVSDETGHPEVSVRNVSGLPRRFVISGGGGDQPVWRRDGSELFFVDLTGRLRSVSVQPTSDGSLMFGAPVELNIPPIGTGHWSTQYDVSPDGSRVYFLRSERAQTRDEIGVVTGWRSLIR